MKQAIDTDPECGVSPPNPIRRAAERMPYTRVCTDCAGRFTEYAKPGRVCRLIRCVECALQRASWLYPDIAMRHPEHRGRFN